jgi:acyl carrier protein
MQSDARVLNIFRDVCDDDTVTIANETPLADLPGWDSVMLVKVALALEEAFGVQFGPEEVFEAQTVGDLASLINARG